MKLYKESSKKVKYMLSWFNRFGRNILFFIWIVAFIYNIFIRNDKPIAEYHEHTNNYYINCDSTNAVIATLSKDLSNIKND